MPVKSEGVQEFSRRVVAQVRAQQQDGADVTYETTVDTRSGRHGVLVTWFALANQARVSFARVDDAVLPLSGSLRDRGVALLSELLGEGARTSGATYAAGKCYMLSGWVFR